MSQAVVPVVRALILSLVLALAAAPAWAGIVPSFGSAHVDSFQNGVWPDANFNGITCQRIFHNNTVGDSLNWALADTNGTAVVMMGGTAVSTYARTLLRWSLGSYFPSSRIVDSMKVRVDVTTLNAADSILVALVLKNWVTGTGDGNLDGVGNAADTTGVSWRSFDNETAGGGGDSLWDLRGADSCYTQVPATGTSRATTHSPREQSIAGTLIYDGNQDREGSWHFAGPVLTAAWTLLDISGPGRFIMNDLRASKNYGVIMRSLSEGVTGAHRVTFPSGVFKTANLRPILIIYSHDVQPPVVIGGGN